MRVSELIQKNLLRLSESPTATIKKPTGFPWVSRPHVVRSPKLKSSSLPRWRVPPPCKYRLSELRIFVALKFMST